MNLRDLEYLTAVYDLRHFRKAAERCHVSQPTLSGQLKKLEEYLGVQLMERGSRNKVIFTPIGDEVVRRARNILSEAAEIEDLARSGSDPMSGRLRVGVIPTLAPYLLPLVMDPIRANFPKLRLLVQEAQTEAIVGMLKRGELDLAILALPVPGEGFCELDLFREPFYLAVPRNHPLAKRAAVDTDDLSGQQVLLLEDGHCLRGQALDICFAAGAKEVDNFRATSLETLRHLVAADSGVTLVPELAVDKGSVGNSAVVYVPFKPPAPTRRIGLLYRKNASRVETFQRLGAALRDVIVPELEAA